MSYSSASVCRYFLQGNCRYGDRCWYLHPRQQVGRSSQASSQNAGSSRREAWSGHNDRYSNVQTSSFSKPSNWHSNRDNGKSYFGHQAAQGFSQNRFAALNSSENISTDGTKDDEEHLLELIMKDMEIWESSGQWMFSSYSPLKDKSNISGFPAFLPEELRLEYYNCRANNNIQNYITSVQQLVTQWRSRLLELKHMNASTKSVLKAELKKTPVQPPPAFGFGGQNTSAFGTSTFPVSNQSSAQAFSFKAPSDLAQVSTGSAPAFGNITNVQNHSVLSANSSSTASHSVGFGNQAAPSATAFSFKSTATSGGFGASGFSGFGKSLLSSSSGATSASVIGTTVAAPTLHSGNTLFGQPANASGNNAALAPTILPPSSATEKLFTPKTELSMEELKQFEAKKFTLGKIPLKPPPIELLSIQ